MKNIWLLIIITLISTNAMATEINEQSLNLNAAQVEQLNSLNQELKNEIDPIIKNIENQKQEILEIEKRYFENFWNILNKEQRDTFAKLQQAK